MEALDHLDPDEQTAVLAMLEGAILRHQIRQIGLTQPTASRQHDADATARSDRRAVPGERLETRSPFIPINDILANDEALGLFTEAW